MPQLQPPILPGGATEINSGIAVQKEASAVWYIRGHLPVFQREETDVPGFRTSALTKSYPLLFFPASSMFPGGVQKPGYHVTGTMIVRPSERFSVKHTSLTRSPELERAAIIPFLQRRIAVPYHQTVDSPEFRRSKSKVSSQRNLPADRPDPHGCAPVVRPARIQNLIVTPSPTPAKSPPHTVPPTLGQSPQFPTTPPR